MDTTSRQTIEPVRRSRSCAFMTLESSLRSPAIVGKPITLHNQSYTIAGALPAYRGIGLAYVLAGTLYKRYQARGFKEAFYYPVHEENKRSRKFAESMGGTGGVLAHCYDKRLG